MVITMDLPENKLKELMRGNERAKWKLVNNHNITEFREADIKRITSNYTESIGKGGFGEVFKGVLDDGRIVAVKKYKDQNSKESFAKEVTVHCQINNKNVVQLMGYCADENALAMVTEFIPGGNLEQRLHDCDNHLCLRARLRIAISCAEALSCMHDMYQPIIHGDIKPANILLDDSFDAKLTDFGISRLLSLDIRQYTMNVIGSRGYVDPEFLLNGIIDTKNDVYSFGVVLVELITRKKAWENGVGTNLAKYFLQAIHKGKKARELFDAEVTDASSMKIVEKVGKLAADCLNSDLNKRPVMKYVVQRLYILTERYCQQGPGKPGASLLWGTGKVARKSSVTSSSNSTLISRMGSWDIFIRSARNNFNRNVDHRDIRRHLVSGVPLFGPIMDDNQFIDAICERLVSSLCTEGEYIVREGNPVFKMFFIVRGKLQCSKGDGGQRGVLNSITLKPGDFCGEELVGWALVHKPTVSLPSSTWTVKALNEVEAFALRAEDLKFVASQFSLQQSLKLQAAFRYFSLQWRIWATSFIQNAWCRYKRRTMAKDISSMRPYEGDTSSEQLRRIVIASMKPSEPDFSEEDED